MKPEGIVIENSRAGVSVGVLGKESVRIFPVVAFLVAAWMIFFRLGGLPLMEPDEGRNAEVAREMMVSGAWLVPTLDGLPYLDKPAFFFRCAAISLSLFGVDEAAARLPSALSGMAMLVMLFAFCRRLYGETVGSLAVLVASTSPLFFSFSRIVIMDAMLGAFVCASIFAAFLAEEAEGRRRRLWYLASALAAGGATLVKGPVGFLVPALVVSVFNRLDGRRGAARRCFAPLNVLVFLVVVLPWFLGLGAREPGFFYYGLVEESFHRFTTGGSFHRDQPFYYYLPVVFAGLFPWSLLIPEPALLAWRGRSRWTSADRLFLAWAVVVVLLFSLSSAKQPAYVLTAVVALAALIGRVLALALEDPEGRVARLILRGMTVAAMVYAVLVAASIVVSRRPDLLRSHGSDVSQIFLRPLLLFAAGLVVAGAVAVTARRRSSPGWAAVALALFPLSLLTAGFSGLRGYAETRSSKDLAARIEALPGDVQVACFDCFPESVAFYLREPMAIIDPGGSPEEIKSNFLLFRWARQGLDSSLLVDSARLDAWIAERDRPVLLLGDKPERGRVEAMAAARGLPVAELTPEWWGVLIPASTQGER
jgi:4-amino-4-deoxy-L-arabinose transferase-like glycosyltransferase